MIVVNEFKVTNKISRMTLVKIGLPSSYLHAVSNNRNSRARCETLKVNNKDTRTTSTLALIRLGFQK